MGDRSLTLINVQINISPYLCIFWQSVNTDKLVSPNHIFNIKAVRHNKVQLCTAKSCYVMKVDLIRVTQPTLSLLYCIPFLTDLKEKISAYTQRDQGEALKITYSSRPE